MTQEAENFRVAKDRVVRIFRYLEALNQHRNPAKRQIGEQPWVFWFRDLPSHPSVQLGAMGNARDSGGASGAGWGAAQQGMGSDYILRVRRPKLTRAPNPPETVAAWLEHGWEDPLSLVRLRESMNEADDQAQPRVVRFADDPQRVRALESWKLRRDEWARNERPAWDSMKIFERLYELHGRIGRESERLEFVVGDGILSWRLPDGGIYHPVLVQRVQLEFDPDIPEFAVLETEHQVELYSAPFRAATEVDIRGIAQMRDELERGSYHPLGGDDTNGFLRKFVQQLSAHGRFSEDEVPQGETDIPVLGRAPVLFLRERTLGFARAVEHILEDLVNRTDLPGPLINVVGIERPTEAIGETIPPILPGDDPESILFGKPWNPEQVRVAERLEQHGAVLVQGPPGTGKSHTIANLIGHLLAHGKSVLVTAHTTKALRVLREHVVEPLRPLCVSVLESDLESRRQLEASVERIVQRLSESNAAELEAEAKTLATQRGLVLSKIRDLRANLLDAVASEYRDIVAADRRYTPVEAARTITKGRGQHDWIPAPVSPGAALPLSHGDLVDLYRTNVAVSPEDEAELSAELPKPDNLMTPEDFAQVLDDRAKITESDRTYRDDLWEPEARIEDPLGLEQLGERLRQATQTIRESETWRLNVIVAGQRGGTHREPWDRLLSHIEQIGDQAARAQEVYIRYAPRLSRKTPPDAQKVTIDKILRHFERGGRLSKLTLLTHASWREFVQEARVGTESPCVAEHFQALQVAASLETARRELTMRWERQMTSLGAPPSTELGAAPERSASQFAPVIRTALEWHARVLEPVVAELASRGFRWNDFINEQPPNLSPHGELVRLADAASTALSEVLTARANAVKWHLIEGRLKQLSRQLALSEGRTSAAQVVGRLREAAGQLEPKAYFDAFRRLVDLHSRRTDLQRRHDLLAVLDRTAPTWASTIRDRRGAHGLGEMPGEPGAAWLWRQLHDELERRAALSAQELQEAIATQTTVLQRTTVAMIDRRAWAAQVRRTALQQRQALMGWLNIVRRIGSGYGKRVRELRAEAARKMSESRSAVPVWIMPMSRVVEHFDPRTVRFDVVIIDEASQSDAMALVALYMARSVVIVGDHEQVSPDAVGQDLGVVERLIGEYLQGIPNAILYDGRRSVYDIARESFGGTIMLLEHFRCVPEIIQFSNWLSYEGRIKPLRDTGSVRLKPHVVPFRVDGSRSTAKVNRQEALAVASLLVSVMEMPEYANKTLGVVSLIGEEQALEIDRFLRQHLRPDEYERRRVLCGTAAQFQGDERDVMFLSLVDVAEDGPLPLRQEDRFKQRFNVAASRAKDQMWIVHSLEPGRDLKPGDLRHRLIEHARDPHATVRALEHEEARVESELERAVMRRLLEQGYLARSQLPVGHYRIDLVVEGGGQSLAIECDGDRYHPIEKLPEDMARQAILERSGWKFVRVRGSHFFRDPDGAMKPVFERLTERGILPKRGEDHETAAQEQHDDLKERVIRRAAELQRIWAENAESPVHNQGVRRSLGSETKRSIGTTLPRFEARAVPKQETRPGLPLGPQADDVELSDIRATTDEADVEEAPSSDARDDEDREGLVAWTASVAPEVWFGIARWAKEHGFLTPWARSLLFNIGRYVARSRPVSVRQARQAKRLHDQALNLGFNPDRDARK